MDIYVVQQGDTVDLIANKFGVNPNRLVEDNSLEYPYELLIGQDIVIAYPKQTHIVQEGDSLLSIADAYNVTVMQLLRNNSFLSGREYIYPGETLVISYNTLKSIHTMGISYSFIEKKTLIKTLPELTYLTIVNYATVEGGAIIEYYDDSEIIAISKQYGTIPLMQLTTISSQGIPNEKLALSILKNEEFQERHIDQFIKIIKKKGYGGINLVFNYLNTVNEPLYQAFVEKVSKRLRVEGLYLCVTVNYSEKLENNNVIYEKVDYAKMSKYTDELIFLKFKWGLDYGPPEPVANIDNINLLIKNVVSVVPSEDIIIGIPVLGYDWQLPYIPDQSSAASLSISSVLGLAHEVDATIQFDEISQTPNFNYTQYNLEQSFEHIVWFIDARSINAVCKLILEYQLSGKAAWNIMLYYAPVWTIINATFDVVKLI